MGESGRMEACSTSTMALFGKELEYIHDDDLDGSLKEHQIFSEVLFGNESSASSKRCLVTGVINFEADHVKQTDVLFGANSQTSAVTCQTESYNKIGDSIGIYKPEVGCLSGDLTMSTRRDHVVNSIPMKLDAERNNVLDTFPSSKEVGSCTPEQRSDFSCQVTCRLVESSNKGVTSSCYLLKRHSISSRVGAFDEKDVGECRLSNLDSNEPKDMVVNKTTIASPVSQESSATKLLANPSITAATNLGTPRPARTKWKDSCFLELDESEMSVIRNSKNDPRPLLRYHVHQLLRAAGWLVGRRRRNTKFIGEYVFKSPEGRPIREFRRAWISCGEQLLFYASNVVHTNESKSWTDMTEFLSDLSSTVSEIEEQLGNMEPTAALAHTWYLLDPFANVVFIDKTIRLLKGGKAVKANRSLVINSHAPADADADKQCAVPLASNDAFPVCSEDQGTTDASILDTSSLPACRSHNSTSGSGQSGIYLFEVPICSEDARVSLEGCESVSTHQDNRTCDDKDTSQEEGVHGFDTDCLNEGFGGIKSVNDGGCSIAFEANRFSEGKSYKKSKRISVIRLTSLYEQNKFGLSISQNAGMDDTSGEGIQQVSPCSSQFRSNLKGKRCGSYRETAAKKSKRCRLKDDDLLISAIVKKKTFKSASRKSICKSKPLRRRKSQKRGCRLLLRSLNKGGKQFFESKWSTFRSRTVLSWLIHSGIVSLNEVIQYRDPKDYCVVKDGLITWEGILCKCCNKLLSVSEFKNHSGFRLNRPCQNLFTESDKPLTLCQLEAWSAEYKARKDVPRSILVEDIDQNDDSCGRCGDGGELICCDNCPSTFHQACLYIQELPEGSWYCPDCTCRICGDVVINNTEDSESPSCLQCSQCEQKYHEACVGEKVTKSSMASDTWFCCESCQEIYSGLYSRIGLMNILPDGYSWTLLRCIHGDQKVHSAQRFVALKAECNSKLAVALTIMEECFLPMVDPRTGIDMIPHVVYSWGSQFARLNYHGFYTVVLEKDDILTCVASIRIHGVAVAEMPLIATCSKYRRQGMCRRLMNSIEEMLINLKVEKLVISAISSLVETWTIGFGFTPLEDDEKQKLRDINLMVFPGTVWLKKPLYDSKAAAATAVKEEACVEPGEPTPQNTSPPEDSNCRSSEEPHQSWEEPKPTCGATLDKQLLEIKPKMEELQSEGQCSSSDGNRASSEEEKPKSKNLLASEGGEVCTSNVSGEEGPDSSVAKDDENQLGCHLESKMLYDEENKFCLDVEGSHNLCIAKE